MGCPTQTAVSCSSPLFPATFIRENIQLRRVGRRSVKACRLPFSARATKFYPRPACRHALPAWSKGKSSGRGRREVARGGACSQHAGEGSERCDEYCHSGYVLRWAPCKSRLLGALMKTSIRVQSRFYRMRWVQRCRRGCRVYKEGLVSAMEIKPTYLSLRVIIHPLQTKSSSWALFKDSVRCLRASSQCCCRHRGGF